MFAEEGQGVAVRLTVPGDKTLAMQEKRATIPLPTKPLPFTKGDTIYTYGRRVHKATLKTLRSLYRAQVEEMSNKDTAVASAAVRAALERRETNMKLKAARREAALKAAAEARHKQAVVIGQKLQEGAKRREQNEARVAAAQREIVDRLLVEQRKSWVTNPDLDITPFLFTRSTPPTGWWPIAETSRPKFRSPHRDDSPVDLDGDDAHEHVYNPFYVNAVDEEIFVARDADSQAAAIDELSDVAELVPNVTARVTPDLIPVAEDPEMKALLADESSDDLTDNGSSSDFAAKTSPHRLVRALFDSSAIAPSSPLLDEHKGFLPQSDGEQQHQQPGSSPVVVDSLSKKQILARALAETEARRFQRQPHISELDSIESIGEVLATSRNVLGKLRTLGSVQRRLGLTGMAPAYENTNAELIDNEPTKLPSRKAELNALMNDTHAGEHFFTNVALLSRAEAAVTAETLRKVQKKETELQRSEAADAAVLAAAEAALASRPADSEDKTKLELFNKLVKADEDFAARMEARFKLSEIIGTPAENPKASLDAVTRADQLKNLALAVKLAVNSELRGAPVVQQSSFRAHAIVQMKRVSRDPNATFEDAVKLVRDEGLYDREAVHATHLKHAIVRKAAEFGKIAYVAPSGVPKDYEDVSEAREPNLLIPGTEDLITDAFDHVVSIDKVRAYEPPRPPRYGGEMFPGGTKQHRR